jgi:transcriptional regulator with XRE-family HTH domain
MEQRAGTVMPLKQARAARMLTIRGLAQEAGVSTQTVHEVESGKRSPRFGTIKRLSAALGVDPAEVVEFRTVLFGEELGR